MRRWWPRQASCAFWSASVRSIELYLSSCGTFRQGYLHLLLGPYRVWNYFLFKITINIKILGTSLNGMQLVAQLGAGLQIHFQHLGGWSAYFDDSLDIGGGMILRFLFSGSCYAQTHAFSTHFLQTFLGDLFFACQAFFTHLL